MRFATVGSRTSRELVVSHATLEVTILQPVVRHVGRLTSIGETLHYLRATEDPYIQKMCLKSSIMTLYLR